MLTPEQTQLRIRDNELRELKKKYAELESRFSLAKKCIAIVLRVVADIAPWRVAEEYRKMARDLEE